MQFCYYIGGGTSNGHAFSYAVLPDVTTGACAGGCGANAQPIANQTAVASAALANIVTDPGIANATTTARPLGWYDSKCGEIADICNAQQGTITVGMVTWTVQQLWSNAAANCIVTKATLPPICTGPGTPAGCRPCSCADDNQAAAGEVGCAGAAPRCETDAANVKHGQCVACTTNAQCTSGTCTKSADVATDDMCVAPGNDGGVDAAGAGGTTGAGGRGGAAGTVGGATGAAAGRRGTVGGGAGTGGATGAGGRGGAAGTVAGGAGAGGATGVGAGGAAGVGAGGAGGHADGMEGGACYGNGTCNTGLTCLSHLCVMSPKSGGGCGCRIGRGSPEAALIPLGLLVALAAGRRRARRHG